MPKSRRKRRELGKTPPAPPLVTHDEPDDPNDPLPPVYRDLILRLRDLHAGAGAEAYVDAARVAGPPRRQLLAAERHSIVKLRDGGSKVRLRRVWFKKAAAVVVEPAPSAAHIDFDGVVQPVAHRPLIRVLRERGAGGRRWLDRDEVEVDASLARAATRQHGVDGTVRQLLEAAEDAGVIEVDRATAQRRVRLAPLWQRQAASLDGVPVAFRVLVLDMLGLLDGRDLDAGCRLGDLDGAALHASFALAGRTHLDGYLECATSCGVVEVDSWGHRVRFTEPWRAFLESQRAGAPAAADLLPAIDPFAPLVDQLCALGGAGGRPVPRLMLVVDAALRDRFCLVPVAKLGAFLTEAARVGVVELVDVEGEEKVGLLPDYQRAPAEPPDIVDGGEPPAGFGPLVTLLRTSDGGAGWMTQSALFSAMGSARLSLAAKAGVAVRPGFDPFVAYLDKADVVLGIVERSQAHGVRLAPRWRVAPAPSEPVECDKTPPDEEEQRSSRRLQTASSWLDGCLREWEGAGFDGAGQAMDATS